MTSASTVLYSGLPIEAPADGTLCTDNIEVVYPDGTRALEPTRIEFRPGEFTVLLGSSGAGKSTLLRCLNGLVKPTRGRVVAPGLGDLSNPSALRRHRSATGMVFQQHHLIGRLSVLENVLTGRLGHHGSMATLIPWSREEKTRALAAIDRVGLLDYALKRADQLSGGQQQRVGVARALVQQPRTLLADEPVASLDPATAERLLELIRRICKQDGITAIVSLHQLDLARRFADRIVALRRGHIVFDGPAAALTDETASDIYAGITPKEQPREAPDKHGARTSDCNPPPSNQEKRSDH